MSSWGLLDEKEENELHKLRLLNVEEKPFKRITKRLATLHSLASSRSRQLPTPPLETSNNGITATNAPNGSSTTAAAAAAAATAPEDVQSPASAPPSSDAAGDVTQLKEDITLDFAAFTSNVVRLQLLLTANEEQRAHYAAERERILATSQRVRDDTASLRGQLAQARATLEQRRRFDELADRITGNRNLRSRAEQANNLQKLEEEIAQLEAESEAYAATWRERRDQFERIMDESMRLRRQIRDEKEEVERREGMDDEEGAAGAGDADDSNTPKPGIASGNATPRPDTGGGSGGSGGAPPSHLLAKSGLENGERAGTPGVAASTAGGRTPAGDSPAPSGEGHQLSSLKPTPDAAAAAAAGSFSQNGSHRDSREPSPNPTENREEDRAEDGEDVDMEEPKDGADMGEVKQEGEEDTADSPLTPLPTENTPRIVVDSEDADDKMDTT